MRKGKNKGEANGNAKLTEKKVIKIRSLRGQKTHLWLARKFNVSVGLIGMIMSRKVWAHVRQPRHA